MNMLKIAIIGAGSTYTPELIEGIIKRHRGLPVTHLALMDIDSTKLDIVGQLSQRMIRDAGLDIEVFMTEDLDRALTDADFVLAQIRVGKLAARVLDETIPLKYGFIGQETTGMGGFFKALRTIPVMMNIAHRMEELCPNAWLINFSNPSGIIAQALQNHTKIKSVGLCNVPINMFSDIHEALEEENLTIEYVGLNHLSYITGIWKSGQDIFKEVLEKGITGQGMKNIPIKGFDAKLIQSIEAIPSSYLEYFYDRNDKLDHLRQEEKSRGQVCMDIEERLLDLYKKESLTRKPQELEKRGGARYSEAAISLVDSIYNDKGETHVVNVPNQGALAFMDHDDVVEVACQVGREEIRPLAIHNFNNKHVMEMMQCVKAYENHTVQAAIHGSDAEAIQALLIHPLVGDFANAVACYEEMKIAHKKYLTQFVD